MSNTAHCTVLLENTKMVAEALEVAGVPVSFYTVVGAGHGGFDDPQISSLVHTFLATHLMISTT